MNQPNKKKEKKIFLRHSSFCSEPVIYYIFALCSTVFLQKKEGSSAFYLQKNFFPDLKILHLSLSNYSKYTKISILTTPKPPVVFAQKFTAGIK